MELEVQFKSRHKVTPSFEYAGHEYVFKSAKFTKYPNHRWTRLTAIYQIKDPLNATHV